MSQTLLLTGGTGYIGSHAAVVFIEAGYQVVLLDNLCNSSLTTLDKIEKITGVKPRFYEGDIRDKNFLETVFINESIDAVIHFAGLKAVGESCEKPFLYHENNTAGSMTLFEVMEKHSCRSIVFSSSATVYRQDNIPPFTESSLLGTTNPYGTSKLIVEQLLTDFAHHANWKVINLRYFNPIGAHPSWLIGEKPNGVPNNLLPYIMDVASGKRERVSVHGDDYSTIDGTGMRDYIHVVDLALAHVQAITHLSSISDSFVDVFNIGTGKGTSVLEMIEYTKKVSGVVVPYVIGPKRTGDIASVYCDANKAERILSWKATRSVEEGVKDSWNFVSKNL